MLRKGDYFRCRQCKELFKVQANLEKHLMNIHGRHEMVPYAEGPRIKRRNKIAKLEEEKK